MKREIKRRKMRFVAMCVTLSLLLCNFMSLYAFALPTGYETEADILSAEALNLQGKIIQPGEIIVLNPGYDLTNVTVQYFDISDTFSPISIDGNYTTEAIQGGITFQDPYTNADIPASEISYFTAKNYSTTDLGVTTLDIEDGRFAGWLVDYVSTSSGALMYINLVPVDPYIISYHLNGGTNNENNPTTIIPSEFTQNLQLYDATKTGHTFGGWYLDENFQQGPIPYFPPNSINADIDLYAKFDANSYTINYELNGGSLENQNPSSYTYGDGVDSFNEPSKDNYTFDGWYNNAEFNGNAVTAISNTQTGDITLYAKYNPNTYDITYELNGGTNNADNPTGYTYGVGVASFNEPTKTGHTFVGWYSNADFTGDKVTAISDTQTGDITLYAKFDANSYTIDYELNGGTVENQNPSSYTYGEGVASFNAPTKEEHTFDGWYNNADFTGDKVTAISDTQTGDVTLYAKYNPNTYDITYELNGGTNNADNPTGYTYGVGVASFNEPTKTGHTFVGWYSNADFTGDKVTTISNTQTGDVTLYAKFTANSLPGGEGNSGGEGGSESVPPTEDSDEEDTIIEEDEQTDEDEPIEDEAIDEDEKFTPVSSPKTGDNTPIGLMLIIMLVSAAVLVKAKNIKVK